RLVVMVSNSADIPKQLTPAGLVQVETKCQRRNSHCGAVTRCPISLPSNQRPMPPCVKSLQCLIRARAQSHQVSSSELTRHCRRNAFRIDTARSHDRIAGRQRELSVIGQHPVAIDICGEWERCSFESASPGVADRAANEAAHDSLSSALGSRHRCEYL